MCQGKLRLVDAVPISEEFSLKCHHEAFIQVVYFECQELIPHPFISNEEYGTLTPCPEHGDRQMIQLAVVATNDAGHPDSTHFGERILAQCSTTENGEHPDDECPTCRPIQEAETGFYNGPDSYLAAHNVRCPACEEEQEAQVAA